MADFFARLAARLLDADNERLRPNLSTRFAPAPEIGPHVAQVVLPGHEPAGIPSAYRPPPAPSRGQPSAPQPGPSNGQPSVPPHNQPDAPSGDLSAGSGSRHAASGASLLGPAGEPAPPVVPASTASVASANEDSPKTPAGPAWRPTNTATPERDQAAAPGQERRRYADPHPPRPPATPDGETTAVQLPGAGEVPAGGTRRTGGAQPIAAAAGQSAPAAGQSARALTGDLPDAMTPPQSEPARAPDSPHQSSPTPAASGTYPTVSPMPPPPPPPDGAAVTDDAVIREDVSGAPSGPPPATARRGSPSEPRLTSYEPARRPRPGSSTDDASVRDGDHMRQSPPDSDRTEELTVDIELLEIVERQPPSRTPSARRPPVSLSDYLARRAH